MLTVEWCRNTGAYNVIAEAVGTIGCVVCSRRVSSVFGVRCEIIIAARKKIMNNNNTAYCIVFRLPRMSNERQPFAGAARIPRGPS